jgi:hypothetical protein
MLITGRGNKLVISDNQGNLNWIDITDPSEPELI